ncbi:MAG: hypothetical protein KGM47_12720 [Acidobacteriota bacterium]|nr:hypothetical protein [Acidobacteriota bacterium]
MTTFADLYEQFKNSPLHVKRNAVRDAVLKATGAQRVHIHAATMNTTVCRGMYFSPRNATHGLDAYVGQHVIAISRDLNTCWSRMVIVKELMHMLDGADSATDSGEAFERVFSELNGVSNAQQQSPQSHAEVRAFWMALAILVPENHRVRLKASWLSDQREPTAKNFAVAKELLIPAIHVPRLFGPQYERILESLVAGQF